MFAQTCLVLVRLAAILAFERLLVTLMLLHVLAQVWTRNETLLTYLALIRFLPRMDSFVSDEVTHLWESPATHFTRVGLNLLMDAPLVLLQRRKLGKCWVTDRTLKRPFSCVRPLMLLQCLLATEAFVASFGRTIKLEWRYHTITTCTFCNHSHRVAATSSCSITTILLWHLFQSV